MTSAEDRKLAAAAQAAGLPVLGTDAEVAARVRAFVAHVEPTLAAIRSATDRFAELTGQYMRSVTAAWEGLAGQLAEAESTPPEADVADLRARLAAAEQLVTDADAMTPGMEIRGLPAAVVYAHAIAYAQEHGRDDGDARLLLLQTLTSMGDDKVARLAGTVRILSRLMPSGPSDVLDRYEVQDALTNCVALVCRRCDVEVDGDCGGSTVAGLARLAAQHEAEAHGTGDAS